MQRNEKQAWTDLRNHAVSVGLVSNEKDFTYIRDTTWPNLRQRTMTKVDKSNKTGEDGGTQCILDEIDLLVLEVIGEKSPVINGIGIPDSMGLGPRNHETKDMEAFEDENGLPECLHLTPIVAISSNSAKTSGKPLRKALVVRTREDNREMERLKKRKLELEIRKLELEVWEKEHCLGFKHSTLTEGLERDGNVSIIVDLDEFDESCGTATVNQDNSVV